jgi:uncharacterized membrane protein
MKPELYFVFIVLWIILNAYTYSEVFDDYTKLRMVKSILLSFGTVLKIYLVVYVVSKLISWSF